MSWAQWLSNNSYALQSTWQQRSDSMDCTVLGRVSGKTRGPLGAQDSISYGNSHTPSLPEKLIIVVVFIVTTISFIKISPSCWSIPGPLPLGSISPIFCLLSEYFLLYPSTKSFWICLLKINYIPGRTGLVTKLPPQPASGRRWVVQIQHK